MPPLPDPTPAEQRSAGAADELFRACRDGEAGTVERLLRRHPDICKQRNFRPVRVGYPLEIACTSSHRDNVKIIKLLLKHGADVHQRDPQFGQAGIHRAAECGLVDVIACLLENGADPNEPDGMGQTPLHFAAEYGRTEACRLLIKRGAGPSKDVLYYDQTPREWAERNGFLECASIL